MDGSDSSPPAPFVTKNWKYEYKIISWNNVERGNHLEGEHVQGEGGVGLKSLRQKGLESHHLVEKISPSAGHWESLCLK